MLVASFILLVSLTLAKSSLSPPSNFVTKLTGGPTTRQVDPNQVPVDTGPDPACDYLFDTYQQCYRDNNFTSSVVQTCNDCVTEMWPTGNCRDLLDFACEGLFMCSACDPCAQGISDWIECLHNENDGCTPGECPGKSDGATPDDACLTACLENCDGNALSCIFDTGVATCLENCDEDEPTSNSTTEPTRSPTSNPTTEPDPCDYLVDIFQQCYRDNNLSSAVVQTCADCLSEMFPTGDTVLCVDYFDYSCNAPFLCSACGPCAQGLSDWIECLHNEDDGCTPQDCKTPNPTPQPTRSPTSTPTPAPSPRPSPLPTVPPSAPPMAIASSTISPTVSATTEPDPCDYLLDIVQQCYRDNDLSGAAIETCTDCLDELIPKGDQVLCISFFEAACVGPFSCPSCGPCAQNISDWLVCAPTEGGCTTYECSGSKLQPTGAPTQNPAPSSIPSSHGAGPPSAPVTEIVTSTISPTTPTKPPDLLTKEFTGITLKLVGVGKLDQGDWDAFEAVTESWCQWYFADNPEETGVRNFQTTIRVTAQEVAPAANSLLTKTSNTLTYWQTMEYYVTNENAIIVPYDMVTAPFLDLYKNQAYLTALAGISSAFAGIATRVQAIPQQPDSTEKKKSGIIVWVVVGVSLVFGLLSILVVYCWNKSRKNQEHLQQAVTDSPVVTAATTGRQPPLPAVSNTNVEPIADGLREYAVEYKDQVRSVDGESVPFAAVIAVADSTEELFRQDSTQETCMDSCL